MFSFEETMDPHSVDVMRDGRIVARLQWHSRMPMRVVTTGAFAEFTVAELRAMIAELERRVDRDL